MDMVFNYLPDVFSYQSQRHFNYENNPWLNESTNKDSSKSRNGTGTTKKSSREPCKDTKDSCPICQERQRRPLATYIRSKSRQDRKEEECILEEECENEDIPQEDDAPSLSVKDEHPVNVQQQANAK